MPALPRPLESNGNESITSSIFIWLDDHPDYPEEYVCEYQSRPYKSDNNSYPASLRAWPQSPKKRRKLGEVSVQSMNTRSQHTRRTSPRKAAADPQCHSLRNSYEFDNNTTTIEVRCDAPSTPVASPTRLHLLDQDTTPKPPSLNTLPHPSLSYTIPVPIQPSDSRSNASSPSRSNTSSSRATSTRSAPRTRSPVKRIGDFHLSSVPITLHDFSTPSHPLPLAAKALVRDLRQISAGRGVIPHNIKERAMPYLEDIIFDDLCFADLDRDFDVNAPARHDNLWRQVLDILEAARECRTCHLPEASWNAEVHSRLLRAALAGHWRDRGVWYRDITTAKIADVSLLPTAYSGSSSSAIMQSKMVDYALIVDPNRRLGARIAETLRREGRSSINQTGAEHVRFSPIGVSFETKRAAVDEDEADVQLGIWAVAHFARLRQMTRSRAAQGEVAEKEIPWPILPLVIIQGHDWKMMVAEAVIEPGTEDYQVAILRDLRLGATDTVLGIYQLVEAMRRLARWVDEEYRTWLEREALFGDGEL